MGSLFSVIAAYKELFPSYSGPIDPYFLSACSKRTSRAISFSDSRKFTFRLHAGVGDVDINEDFTFIVTHKTDEDYSPSCFQVPSLERCVIEYTLNDNFVRFVYPENDLENFATVVHHLQNIFKCPITSFKYFRVIDKNWFQMFKSIMEYQTTPLDYMTLSVNIKKEELEWVTEHIKVTDYLELITNGAKSFEMDFTTECKKLFVRSTFLIDTRNLLQLKSCSSFKLMDSQLALKDLDLFMRRWVEGWFPKLVYMSIDSQGFKYNHQIYGFWRQDIGLINGRERRQNINHPNHEECFGGVEIRANDGTRAIMQMSESDVFKLFVMKD
ncbi:hypothetical protein CAEBREN_09290 [Caenorhabditis brenneri]|uniref:Sdz-33 F-box domain-containing protein n=1 Tax=Caenorhabditis brenneri TaxID=135651 RepID=G0N2C1_CAEBE|nr:hypothetical protein CAEBREN_09290 [Caenorhabditis brenneri]